MYHTVASSNNKSKVYHKLVNSSCTEDDMHEGLVNKVAVSLYLDSIIILFLYDSLSQNLRLMD